MKVSSAKPDLERELARIREEAIKAAKAEKEDGCLPVIVFFLAPLLGAVVALVTQTSVL